MNLATALIFFSLIHIFAASKAATTDTAAIDKWILTADTTEDRQEAVELYHRAHQASLYLDYVSGILSSADALARNLARTGLEDSAVHYNQLGLDLARQQNRLDDESAFHRNLGWIFKKQGEFAEALEHFVRVEEIGFALGDSLLMADGFALQAALYDDMGDYAAALSNNFKALHIYQDLGELEGVAKTYVNLSIIYNKKGDRDKALSFNLKSIDLSESLGDQIGLAIGYVDIGILFKDLGKIDTALYYHQQALAIFEKANMKYGILSCYHNIAKALAKRGEHREALVYFKKSLEICEKGGYRKPHALNLNEMARACLAIDDIEKAQTLALEGLSVAEQINSAEELRNAHETLSEIFEKKGQGQTALQHYRLFIQYRDSISGNEKEKQIAAIQIQHNLTEKEREIELLKKENLIQQASAENQRLAKYALVVAVLFGLLFLGVLALANWGKTQANKALQAKRREIQKQKEAIQRQKEELEVANVALQEINSEKDRLVGIVAHDLRSPLNQIKGLLTIMQIDSGNLTEDQLDYISKAWTSADRLTAMINRILDLKAINSQKVNLKIESADMRRLLEQSASYYRGEAERKNIRLHISAPEEPCIVKVDRNYMIQVYENLISNAIKFSPSDKNIFLKVRSDGEQVYSEIIDEGPGISEEDQKKLFGIFQRLTAQPTGGEKSTGLGLSIVKKYVEAMQGSVRCESQLDKGTKFIVSFKKYAKEELQPQES